MKPILAAGIGLALVLRGGSAVLPPDAVVGGLTQAEWSAEWWKWAWTNSTNENPHFDTTGQYANTRQPEGEVFFVVGLDAISGNVKRSFSVPEGKYLFVPLINTYCDNVDVIPPMSIDELRQCAAAQVDAITELHASINGVAVTNLFAYRQISPVFNFVHETADNLESWAAGHPVVGLIDPAVADGFYIMIEPLEPGAHVINFGGSIGQQFQFVIDITDTITVVAVTLFERVARLLVEVKTCSLNPARRHALEASLNAALASFELGRSKAGMNQLRAFQNKVRAQVASVDPALAESWDHAAQAIFDRVAVEGH